MIRDTSAQDRPLSTTPVPRWRRWLWPAAGGAVSNNELARARDALEKARIGLEGPAPCGDPPFLLPYP